MMPTDETDEVDVSDDCAVDLLKSIQKALLDD